MRIAVNISQKQFQLLDLAEMVERVLVESGLEPCWLELEVPENILLRNDVAAVQTLGKLSRLGVQITLDNFGIGGSSFCNFRKCPVNALNIDHSLIQNICSSIDDEALVTALVSLAKCLKLDIVAEGVETEDQRKLLESLECTVMQGFLFSRPLPADDLSRFIKNLKKFKKQLINS